MHAYNVRIFLEQCLKSDSIQQTHQGSEPHACIQCENIFRTMFEVGLHCTKIIKDLQLMLILSQIFVRSL